MLEVLTKLRKPQPKPSLSPRTIDKATSKPFFATTQIYKETKRRCSAAKHASLMI
jgi:hypothetical protein